MDISELEDTTISLSRKLVSSSKEIEKSHENLLAGVKELKVLCTKGPTFQNLIANTNGMITSLKSILESNTDDDLKLNCFQLIANICVQNKKVQAKVHDELGDLIMHQLNSEDTKFVNVASMLTHNMLLNGTMTDIQRILTVCLCQSQKLKAVPDFLHILLDHLICSHKDIVGEYKKIDESTKKNFLLYVNDHAVNESSE
jgi:ataxin-10